MTYRKKSLLQNSFPSLLKHFSFKVTPQSKQRTQLACQGLSRTFNRYLSKIAFSQPAQVVIMLFGTPGERPEEEKKSINIVKLRSTIKRILCQRVNYSEEIEEFFSFSDNIS